MLHLARKLRLTDYFTLAWGTMVGVGWLVVMDDWLLRGGALGALLGFAIGGALLFPIGWVYGRLVAAMPDAASEIAYTAAAFSRPVSFSTGWMMILAYFIVCPWEAVAVGRIAGYIVPSLDSLEIYRIAGRSGLSSPPHIGLGLTALLTTLNYRGIRLSATFQNWTAFGTLALFVVFVALGVQPRVAPQLSAALYPRTAGFVPARGANRPVFHDRIRIREQGCRRVRSRVSRPGISQSHMDGRPGRHSLLHNRHRRSRIRRSMARIDRGEIHDRSCLPARTGLALDRQRDPGGGVAVAVQVLQWEFRSRQPPPVCPGTPRPGRGPALAGSIPNIKRRRPQFCASDWPQPRVCSWEMRSSSRLPRSARSPAR